MKYLNIQYISVFVIIMCGRDLELFPWQKKIDKSSLFSLCLSAVSQEESCLRTLLPESITARQMPGTVCLHSRD